MKTAVLVLSAVAACLSAGSALAHSPGHDRHRDRYERRDWHDQRHLQRHHHGDYRQRHHGYRGHPHYMMGARPHHQFYRGDYLPRHYRDRSHWVDWQYHALPRPMYGHSWFRTGQGFVLVHDHSGRIVTMMVLR